MWLSCQAIIWISVLAGLFRVFANQVTYVADCLIRDDCSIRVYRSIKYTRVQKSGQAIARLPGAVPPAPH